MDYALRNVPHDWVPTKGTLHLLQAIYYASAGNFEKAQDSYNRASTASEKRLGCAVRKRYWLGWADGVIAFAQGRMAAPGGNPKDFKGASKWLENLDDVKNLKPAPAAIIIATQGSGDARGLEAALSSGAAYIGLIASPKKSARLKQTLRKRGHEATKVDAIDAPAGIDIGAVTPEEVAVSILAELVQRKRLESQEQTASEDDQSRVS